jgi:regulator of sirC expression with transglutaminase-like and TPR domain
VSAAIVDVLVEDIDDERVAFDVESSSFSLLRAVALLPRIEERNPDLAFVEDNIEKLADVVHEHVERGSRDAIAIHRAMFTEDHTGFAGDIDDVDAPMNSFLTDVLRRRRGLPIALSVIVVEVAQRAGLVSWGLGLPGHFMVALAGRADSASDDDASDDERNPFVVIDPFHRGAFVSPSDLSERFGIAPTELGEWLAPASPLTVLTRMLMNLKGSYSRRQDTPRLLKTLQRLLLLHPRQASFHLDKASVLHMLHELDAADAALATARTLPLDETLQKRADAVAESIARTGVLN